MTINGASDGSGRVQFFALALVLAAAALLTLGSRSDSRLTFELRGGATAHAGIIEAQRGEATVALSDGSAILAENATRFQVEVAERSSAVTRLFSGRLHASVVHHDDTSYLFVAGPYQVRVLGTELDLAWSQQRGLELSVSKGSVRLLEPGGAVLLLNAGDSIKRPPAAATQ